MLQVQVRLVRAGPPWVMLALVLWKEVGLSGVAFSLDHTSNVSEGSPGAGKLDCGVLGSSFPGSLSLGLAIFQTNPVLQLGFN